MRTPGHRPLPHIFPAGVFEGCVLHPGGSAIGLTTSLHRWVSVVLLPDEYLKAWYPFRRRVEVVKSIVEPPGMLYILPWTRR